jgi:8-oxo-dGTP pyrophosphatase MutT (NUDIX family)
MSSLPDDEPTTASHQPGHHCGAVAVIVRDETMLIIRRSRTVRAPGAYCFPGGGIEEGESERDALVRELAEELSVRVTPLGRLWESVTPWGVHLAWWSAHLPAAETPVANLAEVEAIEWLTIREIQQLDGLLPSNHDFLAALASGHFSVEGISSERTRDPRSSVPDGAD